MRILRPMVFTRTFTSFCKYFTVCVAVSFSMNSALAAPEFDFSGDALSRFLARGNTQADATANAEARPYSNFVDQMRNKASDMVMTSMNFLGVPYVRGGTSAEGGFDCSGFTRYIFEHSLGLVLPRRADEQAKAAGLVNVKRDELKPGDLVFFNTLKRTFSHVGIYIGEGKFIHSPRSGGEVRVEDMRQSYWTKRFTGGRRVPVAHVQSNTPATSAAGSAMSNAATYSANAFGSASTSQTALSTIGSQPGVQSWMNSAAAMPSTQQPSTSILQDLASSPPVNAANQALGRTDTP